MSRLGEYCLLLIILLICIGGGIEILKLLAQLK